MLDRPRSVSQSRWAEKQRIYPNIAFPRVGNKGRFAPYARTG